MKLTTFIKTYKIALASTTERVSNWNNIYLCEIHFPEDDGKIKFTFSNEYDMKPGAIAISVTIDSFRAESIEGGLKSVSEMMSHILDSNILAREYINHNEKINEAGRMVVLFDTLMQHLKEDTFNWKDAIIKDVLFNFEDDAAKFLINDKSIITNGCLVLFGN